MTLQSAPVSNFTISFWLFTLFSVYFSTLVHSSFFFTPSFSLIWYSSVSFISMVPKNISSSWLIHHVFYTVSLFVCDSCTSLYNDCFCDRLGISVHMQGSFLVLVFHIRFLVNFMHGNFCFFLQCDFNWFWLTSLAWHISTALCRVKSGSRNNLPLICHL